eukprot:5948879-Amphidinium_carterae.1
MSHPAQGTPLPQLVLQPGGPVPQNMDLTPVGAPFQAAATKVLRLRACVAEFREGEVFGGWPEVHNE